MSSAQKACCSDVISYKTHPRLHMSVLKSYGLLAISSGLM